MSEKTQQTAMLTQGAYELAGQGALTFVVYHRNGISAERLHGDGLVIGRVAPADIVVDDTSLSRQHARIACKGDAIFVEDLGSTNGTWYRGERVERVEVSVGDEIVLGSVVCCVHRPTSAAGALFGMLGHDAFLEHVDAEARRARYFGRSFAVVAVTRAGDASHVRHWGAELSSRLRPVDVDALFSEDTVQICLPEVDRSEADALIAAMIANLDDARAAVAMFPSDGGSAGALTAACRRGLEGESRSAEPEATLISKSEGMRETLETARLLARGVIPVLLQGETGAGKEVVARYIHERSPRKNEPLVALNCGAIPPQLVESTLFGHEKGAFTGATSRRVGVFEAAAGGTLFLDEIGELPASAQAALLRVLETKRIVRVGSTKEIAVAARIIAASHRDLEAMAEDGLFRKDLFFRLNAMTLKIPPLRERRADIAPLAQRFLELANEHAPEPVSEIAPDALHALERHAWPGNVRELRNAIERGVIIARHGRLTRDELPERIRHAPPITEPFVDDEPEAAVAQPDTLEPLRRRDEDFRACMERLETEVIVTVLEGCKWNKAEAARRLRMPRRTLVHRIKALGIARPER